MTRRLPNLKALRVFEAAARHGSFKAAGDELHVTHAAVSHQIKALEDDLGIELFYRVGRGVRLTAAAAALAERLGQAFDDIDTAVRDLDGGRMRGTLRLSIAPFYGNRIVLPRLSRFHAAHPDLRIELDMDGGLVDFRADGYDAALRYGAGDWHGVTATLLHFDHIAPVAAPSFMGRNDTPLPASEIAAMTLGVVKGQERAWQDWFAAAGHSAGASGQLVTYSNRARAIDIAFSGQGVALADLRILAQDIADGHLVRLSDVAIASPLGMWMVYPETRHPDPRVIAFGDWLREEALAIPVS